jgi:hypothetical protein
MKKLDTVTLLGVDCVDIDRLILAADICQKDFQFAEVKLLTSIKSDHPHIVPIEPINSTEAYSKFVISQLDTYIDTPHVLICQYDGFILNPDAWTDEFLKYDYIGAPWLVNDWSVTNYGFPKDTTGTHIIGNGGFSLRTKKLHSLLARMNADGAFETYHPEDVVIGVYKRKDLEAQGIQFPPIELAKQFSYEAETKEKNAWDGQFGFHGLRWTDISTWLKQHPEYPIDNTLT